MANIHRLGDYNNNQNYQNMGGGGNQQMLNVIGGNITEDPRGENFWDMLKKSFCPKLQLISFTTIICTLIVILYIIMLSVGGIDKNTRFLSVQWNTFKNFGANTPYDVKYSYEIFQWITSLLLIPDFYFLVIAIFMILISYSILESSQGYQIALAIYFGGGITGALFGDLCNLCSYEPYSEVFSSIYACIGCLLGFIILYWKKFDALGDMKCMILCFAAMVLIFVLIFTLGSGQTLYYDGLGQLGGFLGGMSITLILVKVPQSGKYEEICKMIGITFLSLQIGLSIILLFALSC